MNNSDNNIIEMNLLIVINYSNNSIMALNEDGESIAFGVEHSFDEAYDEKFAPELRESIKKKIVNKGWDWQ